VPLATPAGVDAGFGAGDVATPNSSLGEAALGGGGVAARGSVVRGSVAPQAASTRASVVMERMPFVMTKTAQTPRPTRTRP
jgi:hypothetical protein